MSATPPPCRGEGPETAGAHESRDLEEPNDERESLEYPLDDEHSTREAADRNASGGSRLLSGGKEKCIRLHSDLAIMSIDPDGHWSRLTAAQRELFLPTCRDTTTLSVRTLEDAKTEKAPVKGRETPDELDGQLTHSEFVDHDAHKTCPDSLPAIVERFDHTAPFAEAHSIPTRPSPFEDFRAAKEQHGESTEVAVSSNPKSELKEKMDVLLGRPVTKHDVVYMHATAGAQHCPTFIAEMKLPTLPDGNTLGLTPQTFRGEPCPRKIDAEKSAALKALQVFTKPRSQSSCQTADVERRMRPAALLSPRLRNPAFIRPGGASVLPSSQDIVAESSPSQTDGHITHDEADDHDASLPAIVERLGRTVAAPFAGGPSAQSTILEVTEKHGGTTLEKAPLKGRETSAQGKTPGLTGRQAEQTVLAQLRAERAVTKEELKHTISDTVGGGLTYSSRSARLRREGSHESAASRATRQAGQSVAQAARQADFPDVHCSIISGLDVSLPAAEALPGRILLAEEAAWRERLAGLIQEELART